MGCGLRLLSLIVIRDSFFVIREGGGLTAASLYGDFAQAGVRILYWSLSSDAAAGHENGKGSPR